MKSSTVPLPETSKVPGEVKICNLYPDLVEASTTFPPDAVNGEGPAGPVEPPPKPKPPTPLEIPVKTGFSFTKKSLKIDILVISYQPKRKSPFLVTKVL
jgi:hypothetical protein